MDFWDILIEIVELARQIDRDHPVELQKLIPDANELKSKLEDKSQRYASNGE